LVDSTVVAPAIELRAIGRPSPSGSTTEASVSITGNGVRSGSDSAVSGPVITDNEPHTAGTLGSAIARPGVNRQPVSGKQRGCVASSTLGWI
jgi:hypothetical protein